VISELAAQAEARGENGGPEAQDIAARRPNGGRRPNYAGRRPVGGLESENVGVPLSNSGTIRVVADEANNALVILATPEEYRMIEATLERLDIVPLQVLIEATIAEVALIDELSYGLEWFFQSGDVSTTFSSLANGAVSSMFPGFSFVFAGTDARVVLNALTEITDVNVISSPQLMVKDNETASLNIGDQVPISTQSAVSVTDPDAPIVNSIQYRDTGVVLEITPRVNSNGLVILDIIQEVSDVIQTDTSDISSPTIQQRRIETTVVVQSGETVALGGMIRDNRTDSVSGIPLLSDIPILGNLFKTNTEITRRTELIILITPRVIHNVDEATEAMEELRSRMTGLVPLEQRIKLYESAPLTQ
jgi:general secretion pathway protein D